MTVIHEFSSIILICASPQRTRNFILAAKRLGMLDSGQYVFFNMENVQNLDNFEPWVDEEASKSENVEAKEAFQSVLTLNLGSPHETVDTSLTQKVKEVARNEFDYEYKEDVSNLAKNFFDAALVYSKGICQQTVLKTISQNSFSLAYGFGKERGWHVIKPWRLRGGNLKKHDENEHQRSVR